MPLLQTSGNVTADGYGGGVAAVPNYIEDVFSTYLYTGNGSTQTITNGIDLSTKGGLVWSKARSLASHNLYDTARGVQKMLSTNSTNAQKNDGEGGATNGLYAFNADGFSVGPDYYGEPNISGRSYASWTFRKQPKFFDVVTYTGTQNSSGTGQTVSHSLGSTPGCIIIKPLSDTSGSGFTLNDWIVYHRGLSSPTTQYLKLNTTASIDGNSDKVKAVSSTTFTAGWEVGLNGIQYVAYVFAHNAGGFGLTGTDNVISCGSFTTDASGNATVNLGYEPQWYLVKRTDGIGAWGMADIMRGMTVQTSGNSTLFANTSGAESTTSSFPPQPNATGFSTTGLSASAPHIYIAIRRGPMKVPTSGTSVFSPAVFTDVDKLTTAGFPVDAAIEFQNITTSNLQYFSNRLTAPKALNSRNTAAETTEVQVWASNTQVQLSDQGNSYKRLYHMFRRAPSFMDVVCYTAGGSSAQTYNHNLGVSPELIIVKKRSSASTDGWWVGSQFGSTTMNQSRLNATAAGNTVAYTSSSIFAGAPTSTTFTVGNYTDVGDSGSTYVAYLFATCAGVSKVGSYTGNGTTQTINCGFTGGARFVLIKRTDSTGDWYVYDTARGMTTLTDPYLLLNSTAAESATLGSVTTVTTGFAVNASILAAINTNGASYIYISIA